MQFFFNEETKAPNVDCPQMLNVFSLRGVGVGDERLLEKISRKLFGDRD